MLMFRGLLSIISSMMNEKNGNGLDVSGKGHDAPKLPGKTIAG
jgi:hypothetical protein